MPYFIAGPEIQVLCVFQEFIAAARPMAAPRCALLTRQHIWWLG
ncbi:hypothetical protein [Microbulbifer spongiae]|nr:hypothetical protein [Microbulbifer sp. MI-G]